MDTASKSFVGAKSPQITIAIIGLIGVLTTAILSNWDKLFSNVVTASYQGYRPTGNFETELRYFFEITGERKMLENMPKQFATEIAKNRIAQDPAHAKEITDRMNSAVEKGTLKFEDMLTAILPAYSKYFTVSEIQELNKFYSTEPMQRLVEKTPLLQQEIMSVFGKIMMEKQQQLLERSQTTVRNAP